MNSFETRLTPKALELYETYFILYKIKRDFQLYENCKSMGVITSASRDLDDEETRLYNRLQECIDKGSIRAALEENSGIFPMKFEGRGKNKKEVFKTLEELQDYPEFKGKTIEEINTIVYTKYKEIADIKRAELFNNL